MSYNNILDKQSHKLASRSGKVTFDEFGNLNLAYTGKIEPFFKQFGINSAKGRENYIQGMSRLEYLQLPEDLRLKYYDVFHQGQASQANQMFANAQNKSDTEALLKLITPEQQYLDLLRESNQLGKDKLDFAKAQQDHFENMTLTSNIFQGIGQATNLGLGIWNAWEQSQNAQKARDLADEQIAASQEARKQRDDEIKRLKRVRSNTNQRFNSNAIVSRSY